MLLPEGSEIPVQFILYPQNEKEFKFKIFSGTPDEINERNVSSMLLNCNALKIYRQIGKCLIWMIPRR